MEMCITLYPFPNKVLSGDIRSFQPYLVTESIIMYNQKKALENNNGTEKYRRINT